MNFYPPTKPMLVVRADLFLSRAARLFELSFETDDFHRRGVLYEEGKKEVVAAASCLKILEKTQRGEA